MDGWLKALVACACLTIVATGGYFALTEYNAKYSTKAQVRGLLERNQQTIRAIDGN
ncbi:hypothetical protein D3C72_2434050 [compost metagenome]